MLSQKTASGKLRRSHGLLGEGPVSAVLIDAIQAWSRSAAVAPMAARSPSRTSVSGAAFDVIGGKQPFAAAENAFCQLSKADLQYLQGLTNWDSEALFSKWTLDAKVSANSGMSLGRIRRQLTPQHDRRETLQAAIRP